MNDRSHLAILRNLDGAQAAVDINFTTCLLCLGIGVWSGVVLYLESGAGWRKQLLVVELDGRNRENGSLGQDATGSAGQGEKLRIPGWGSHPIKVM